MFLNTESRPITLDGANGDDLVSFIKGLTESGKFTPKTVSRKINSIKTFYQYLIDQKVISDNPATTVKHPQLTKQQPRILSSMEYRALRDCARSNRRMFAIVEILIQTGMRIGELARLNRSDVATGDGKTIIHLNGFESYPPRDIELNEAAARAIQEYMGQTPPPQTGDVLFYTKTGRPLLIRNIRSAIDKIFKSAEVKKATVNDIRNTFIVYQLRSGLKIKELADYVGHQKTITTQRYLELVTKRPAKEIEKVVEL